MKDNSPRAFPSPAECPPADHTFKGTEIGMSLRDYFAGQALAGIAGKFADDVFSRKAAMMCYAFADQMLSVRSQDETE